MDFSTLSKNIFVYFLDKIKPKLYKSILDGNNNIIKILGQPKFDTPLWMISGGEAINYYSSQEDKTPTKDIDCKLLFTGPYNIPKDFFYKFPENIVHLKKFIKKNYNEILIDEGFNFQSSQLKLLNEYFVNYLNNEWNKYIKKLGISSDIFTSGLISRQNILWNCITGLGANGGHLMYISSNANNQFTSINFNEINDHVQQTINEWNILDMDLKDGLGVRQIQFKLYIIKTPYLNVGNNEYSFPYNCEGMVWKITDTQLANIQQKLDAFYSPQVNKEEIWDLYYKTITMMNMRRYLMSLIGVCILVEPNGNKTCIQEGILDLFIDFSAGESKQGKNLYENKLNTGMIPNILKTINYCGKSGYIRIPTLSWLIYDQTRMLYHSLRLQEVSHSGWTDEGVNPTGWQKFEDGKQAKYFSKLKGMLNTYLNVLTLVENKYKTNKKDIVDELQNCTSETNCMPSAFISYIYGEIIPTNFISPEAEKVLCQGGGKYRNKSKKKKNKTRKNINV